MIKLFLLTLSSLFYSIVSAIQTLLDETLSLAFVKTKLLDYETKLKDLRGETNYKSFKYGNSIPTKKITNKKKL